MTRLQRVFRQIRECEAFVRTLSIPSAARVLFATAFCLASVALAEAQGVFPARPVTMVIPFAAGGAVDAVAKIVAQKMSQDLGQQVILEYVVGSGGTTAATRVKRATADGYTIMVGHAGTHGAASALYKSLAYDPVSDFTPIGLIDSTSVIVVTRRDFPATSAEEFVQFSKDPAKPLTMAHAGVGSVSYVACQMFNSLLGLDPHVAAFQGVGPAVAALSQGKVDYLCDQLVSVVPHVREGRVRAFVIASERRSPALPSVPTSVELKMDRFMMTSWMGIFAPKDIPPAVAEKLTSALNAALDDPDTRKQLENLGGELYPAGQRGPDALRATVKLEVSKWVNILKQQ